MNVSSLDLFSGAGGLTRGLLDADINDVDISVEAGFDIDEDCRYPYETNNDDAEFVKADLSTLLYDEEDIENGEIDEELSILDSDDIGQYFDDDADVRMLAGCAPCQPFSRLNPDSTENHEKWELLNAFSKLVIDLEPEIVTMENVPGVERQPIYDEFVETLEQNGYMIDANTLYGPDYGVPQTRKRLVLVASKIGRISLPEPTHDEDYYVTVEDQIGDLPDIASGEQHSDDSLHVCRDLIDRNLQRWDHSHPGGTWRDWPEELRLACHKKESGQSYDSVYGIMEPDEPSPTITTQFYNYGTGRFGHPNQARALSLREGAMLQTFPEDYEFVPENEEVTMKNVGRLIGNAVPVKLAKVVGEVIQKHIEEQEKTPNISSYSC
jgi:DNA (cytosine-5)-methyltransferase 1